MGVLVWPKRHARMPLELDATHVEGLLDPRRRKQTLTTKVSPQHRRVRNASRGAAIRARDNSGPKRGTLTTSL
jgi:hypothetical protein